MYNIAGIQIDDKAPQASDVKAAVVGIKPDAEKMLTFEVNQQLSDIVPTFGFWTTPLPVKTGVGPGSF